MTPGVVSGDYRAASIVETCGLGDAQEAYPKVAAGSTSRIVLRPQEWETAMTGYLVSLLMGLAVGAAYGLVQVRSPAPPIVALVGLFGMVLGQQAVDMAKRYLARTAQASIHHARRPRSIQTRLSATRPTSSPIRIKSGLRGTDRFWRKVVVR